VLATQIRQKMAIFYSAASALPELLAKVRFIQPFLRMKEENRPGAHLQDDEIAQFIANRAHRPRLPEDCPGQGAPSSRISMKRRLPSRRSPDRWLCYPEETALPGGPRHPTGIGQLAEPQSKFLIIDGHTACGTAFYLDSARDDANHQRAVCKSSTGASEGLRLPRCS